MAINVLVVVKELLLLTFAVAVVAVVLNIVAVFEGVAVVEPPVKNPSAVARGGGMNDGLLGGWLPR